MTDPSGLESSPLFGGKAFDEPSVFTPQSLVASARQQKDLPKASTPDVCILNPDGDIVRQRTTTGEARKDETWPGYHTELYRFPAPFIRARRGRRTRRFVRPRQRSNERVPKTFLPSRWKRPHSIRSQGSANGRSSVLHTSRIGWGWAKPRTTSRRATRTELGMRSKLSRQQ